MCLLINAISDRGRATLIRFLLCTHGVLSAFSGLPQSAIATRRIGSVSRKPKRGRQCAARFVPHFENAPHVLSRNRASMFDAAHFDRSSSSALRRGVVRAIAREILRVSRALECNFASLEVRSVRSRRSRARLTLLFSAKYILLLCSICAMLLKIFSRSEENSLESRGKRGFHSFGSPSESRIHRRIAPTVESPAATRRALCLLL